MPYIAIAVATLPLAICQCGAAVKVFGKELILKSHRFG
jgi:hypothetical protein